VFVFQFCKEQQLVSMVFGERSDLSVTSCESGEARRLALPRYTLKEEKVKTLEGYRKMQTKLNKRSCEYYVGQARYPGSSKTRREEESKANR